MKKLFLTIVWGISLIVPLNVLAAIAHDTSATGGTGNGTQTTVSTGNVGGSNRMAVIHITTGSGDNLSALSYDGVDIFNKLAAKIQFGNYNNECYLFLYSNPPTGVKNVTATVGVSNNIEMIIETYTGVKQSDTADATGTAKAGSGTSSSLNVSTVSDNDWLTSNVCTTGSSVGAGANTTYRILGGAPGLGQISSGDSNAAETPPGSFGQAYSWTGSSGNSIIVAALAPPASGAAVSIATSSQYKADGTTTLASGASTAEHKIVFEGTLTSSSSNLLYLQVEVQPSATQFTGSPTLTSAAGVSSGNVASTTLNTDTYVDGNYHWQARGRDAGASTTSAWTIFSGLATSTDFVLGGRPTGYEISDGSVKVLYHFDSPTNASDTAGTYDLIGGQSVDSTSSFSANLNNADWENLSNHNVYTSSTFDYGTSTASATIGVWMKANQSNGVLFLDNNVNFGMQIVSNTKIRCGVVAGGVGTDMDTDGQFLSNVPVFLSCEYAASDGTLRFFVNGVQQNSHSGLSGNIRSQAGQYYVGSYQSANYLPGQLDEAFIVGKEMSTSTLQAIYTAGLGYPICVTAGCGRDPASYYAQIQGTGTLKIRQSPDTSSTIFKTLPADWVVYVSSTVSATGTTVISNGNKWFDVVDKTDGVEGWMAATSSSATYLSYVSSSQLDFQTKASSTLTTSSTRAEKIVNAVDWYWSHVSSTDSLYNTTFTSFISPTSTASSTWIFPKELFYAIASEESGGANFNDEVISSDYGYGIMQLTAKATSSDVYFLQVLLNKDPDTQVATSGPGSSGNETHSFGSITDDAVKRFQMKYWQDTLAPLNLPTSTGTGYVGYYTRTKLNSFLPTSSISSAFRFEDNFSSSTHNKDVTSTALIFDNRGIGSGISIPPCNDLQDPSSNNYLKKCYFDNASSTPNRLYEPHQNYSSTTFKYYTNTPQSFYSNVKDGLWVLKNKYTAASSTATGSSTLFQPYEREWIQAAWGYNGFDQTTTYLTRLASHMDTFSDYISSTGTKMVATSSFSVDLANKLRIADNNKTQVIVYSPVTVSVTDSAGRQTGMVNGVVKEYIPDSAYNAQGETVAVFFANDTLIYNIVGTGEGTYGLLIEHPYNGVRYKVYAPAIPVNNGEVHKYEVNWDTVAKGGKGVALKIDKKGNGKIDDTVVTDANLSGVTLYAGSPPLESSKLEELPAPATQLPPQPAPLPPPTPPAAPTSTPGSTFATTVVPTSTLLNLIVATTTTATSSFPTAPINASSTPSSTITQP